MKICDHKNTEARLMVSCRQIKRQCLDCHQSIGHALPHADYTKEQIDALPHFDVAARDAYWERDKVDAKSIADEAERRLQERRTFYTQYLQSDAWREKRRLVIERQSNICSGCRMAPITEVHHLSYDNLGDELLWQLQGVCRACHEKAHKIKKSTNQTKITNRHYYDKKNYMPEIVRMLRHDKLPCSDFNDDEDGYTFCKDIFIKCRYDDRIYRWLDELPHNILQKLCAASLHKGTLYLYWFGEIPKGYEEGEDIEPTFGDVWNIMYSGAF